MRANLNMTLGGQAVTWSCAAPGAWLFGVDASKPMWVAQYITTNSQGIAITYGPVPVDVTKGWVY